MTVYLNTFIVGLISGLGGTALGLLIGFFRKERAFRRTQTNHNRADLFEHYNKVIANGYTTSYEIEIWEPLFEEYKAGGGDGVIDRLHHEVAELPIKVPTKIGETV